MTKPLVIFLHSDSYDRVYQAVNMILTAASADRKCYLFLFYHALGAYLSGDWDDLRVAPWGSRRADGRGEAPPWARVLERSFEAANVPSLYELLTRAKQYDGEVMVYACSNSVQYLKLEPAEVKERVDEIVGLTTMLEISSGSCQVLYI
jgi:peroxiredoxin family protein